MFQAVSLAIIAVLTVIDRLTKYAAVATVKVDGPKEFLFGLFNFTYVENTGAAFSLFSDKTDSLSILTVLFLAVMLFLLLKKTFSSKFLNASLLLVIAGGLGNLIDRLCYGYVIDFIEPLFVDFAVFNFADCCITVGAFMIIAYEIYEIISERKKKAGTDDSTD
ncbi:MAG: signal peptidase II [Clostridia bacterium]|nr:signal peptidase II [Clostridia bacterium]MBQ3006703.1 signal peptidase II [Clostridia bacterium]